LLSSACADDTAAGVPRDGSADVLQTADASSVDRVAVTVAQTPPQGRAALEPWLAEGHYRAWKCEPGISPPRPNGAHGRTRICSNDLASSHGSGEYAIGAAAVKELYSSGDAISGYAVSHKLAAGTSGAAWYWYERIGSSIVADGVNVGLCSGCHSLAGKDASHQGHDFVYVQAR